jgi:deoxyribodipyrimidine photo-lyase
LTGRAALNPKRLRALNRAARGPGPVIYWMSRDQRAEDNWALLFAQEMAIDARVPLAVVFALDPAFPGGTRRSFGFLLRGLAETASTLREKGIPFFLLEGTPPEAVNSFTAMVRAGAVVTDFSPLREVRAWKARGAGLFPCPLFEVDAHNIVPCWAASEKAEYGAYTLRPKIFRLLPLFLTDFPRVERHPFPWGEETVSPDFEGALLRVSPPGSVPEVKDARPGTAAGMALLREFLDKRLGTYATDRNDPNRNGVSGLSPYLHFGQVSPQRAAWETSRADVPEESRKAFLEELVVRRELSDNFCLYNPSYDRVDGFPAWARQTLEKHAGDPREALYAPEQLENAATGDPLWNAAQVQMATTGRMHGYLRMYWGKKILAWSPSAEEALAAAITLNDRYELDGRDPNGYTGAAWCIGGVHDRPWPERPVFGKIRTMTASGCRRKFDTETFARRFL